MSDRDETRSWFSATDDEAARQFYTLDPQVIGAAIGVSAPAPFTLVAMGPSLPDGLSRSGAALATAAEQPPVVRYHLVWAGSVA